MTEKADILDFKSGDRILPSWILKVIESQYLESRELAHKSFEFTQRLEDRLLIEAGYKTFNLIKEVIRGN